MLTGYLISIYQDINPASLTYGQTRTERELSSDCPEGSGDPNYQITNRYCEMNSNHMKTGYLIVERTDVNPDSATYGDIQTTRTENHTECPPDTTNPNWVDTGEASCEQIQYQSGAYGNSGYKLQVQTDVNQFSSTYMQTRTQRTQDLTTCPLPNTQPTYEIISEICETEVLGNSVIYTGYKLVTRIDTNVYSSTYTGVAETVRVQDTTMCPAVDTTPNWIEISRQCELTVNSVNVHQRTGYLLITYKDVNSASATYNQTQVTKVYDTESCPTGTVVGGTITIYFTIYNFTNVDISGGVIRLNTNTVRIEFVGSVPSRGGALLGSVTVQDDYSNTDLTMTDAVFVWDDVEPNRWHCTMTPSPYRWSRDTDLTFTIMG